MTKIYCRVTNQGVHSFYMNVDGKRYFLFNQNYKKGVQDYYSRGVTVNEAMNHARARYDTAVMKTMTKLPKYIEYIENEFGVSVLEKTKKKRLQNYAYIKQTC